MSTGEILFSVYHGGCFQHLGSGLVYSNGHCSHFMLCTPNITKSSIIKEVVKLGYTESSIKTIYFAYPNLPLDRGLATLGDDCTELLELLSERCSLDMYVSLEGVDSQPELSCMESNLESDSSSDYEDNSDSDDEDVINARNYMISMRDKVIVKQPNGELAVVSECELLENEHYQDSDDADSPFEDSEEETPNPNGQKKSRKRERTGLHRFKGGTDLVVGAQFINKDHFMEVLDNYRIEKGYAVKIARSSKTRVQAECRADNCKWTCWASPLQNELTWVLKTMKVAHTCIPFSFEKGKRHMSSSWLSKKYEQQFRDVPLTNSRQLKSIADRELDMKLSLSMCKNGRRKAILSIVGDYKEQFGSVSSYCHELLAQNPGSTAKIRSNLNEQGEAVFKQMYICIDSLKRGFIDGCRRVISLDGCFLKGPWDGQLLAAVGRDANNQMYPIAWGVAESETTESWRWFMHLLQSDLNIGDGEGWTIISDQQKGLINAVNFYFPKVEHRMCARHVYANIRKYWRGLQYRDIFWKLAKSSNEPHFKRYKTQFQNLNMDAWTFVEKKEPKHFCRLFFKPDSKCDSVDNNMAEVFNATIVEARFKPIVTMLCEIQTMTMARIASRHKWALTLNQPISPRIVSKLEKRQRKATSWRAHDAGNGKWSVQNGLNAFVVHLGSQTCTCGSWQLGGVPCIHCIAVCKDNGYDPHRLVHDCFSPEYLRTTYAHKINPINGMSMWSKPPHGATIVAPFFKLSMKGLRTKRIPEAGADLPRRSGTVSRAGSAKHCGICKQPGHNRLSCTNRPSQQSQSQEGQSQHGQSQQQESQSVQSQLTESQSTQSQPTQSQLTESQSVVQRGSKLPVRRMGNIIQQPIWRN